MDDIIVILVDVVKKNNVVELDLNKVNLDGLQVLEIVYNDIEKLVKMPELENEKAVVIAKIVDVKKYNKNKAFYEFLNDDNKKKLTKLEKPNVVKDTKSYCRKLVENIQKAEKELNKYV